MRRSTRSSTALQKACGARPRTAPSTRTSSELPLNEPSNVGGKRSSGSDRPVDKRIKSESHANSLQETTPGPFSPHSSSETSESKEVDIGKRNVSKATLSETKWKSWSKDAHSPPFPDFAQPTEAECRQSHRILEALHGETVRKNFEYTKNPSMYYPYVMDALVVATLSQATSWANAQRAMKSMTSIYGSPFAYQSILDGGEDKLRTALRPGGMQNRKAKMLLQILIQVRQRHGKWDLNHLFNVSDDDAAKELISYKGVGPKSAFCILSICLQRNSFAVDTHIYRISGLWRWRPKDCSREKAQAHLDARIPKDIKFSLHYLFIVHRRECPVRKGNGNPKRRCEYRELLEEDQV